MFKLLLVQNKDNAVIVKVKNDLIMPNSRSKGYMG